MVVTWLHAALCMLHIGFRCIVHAAPPLHRSQTRPQHPPPRRSSARSSGRGSAAMAHGPTPADRSQKAFVPPLHSHFPLTSKRCAGYCRPLQAAAPLYCSTSRLDLGVFGVVPLRVSTTRMRAACPSRRRCRTGSSSSCSGNNERGRAVTGAAPTQCRAVQSRQRRQWMGVHQCSPVPSPGAAVASAFCLGTTPIPYAQRSHNAIRQDRQGKSLQRSGLSVLFWYRSCTLLQLYSV